MPQLRPRVTADDFSDNTDPVLYPRLNAAQIDQFRRFARAHVYANGDTIFEQGVRNAPLIFIEAGQVTILDRQPEFDVHFANVPPGTFVGDISMFTGEPTVAAALADGETRALIIERSDLHRLAAAHPEVGNILLSTFMARRAWLEGHGYGQIQLIGSRWSTETSALREFLARNQVPFRWLDPERDASCRALLDSLGLGSAELPVVLRATEVIRKPTIEMVATELGLRGELKELYDLAVIGAGPAGLAAGVYGASEGLTTVIIEAQNPGGQAGTSSRIENYLGFATGISGNELTRQALIQARKFGATLTTGSVQQIGCNGNSKVLHLDDGREILAKALIVATGARYRRLGVANLERFEGTSVMYAATQTEAATCENEAVVVVGGANSAGQAAVFLSSRCRRVFMVVRRASLSETMSSYLIERIQSTSNIELVLKNTIVDATGDERLTGVMVESSDGERRMLAATHAFVMIGAEPCTGWLGDKVGLDERGFVVTGNDAAGHDAFDAHWSQERAPFLLETTRPGIFAVGDVRAGSIKRVASAVGEGSMAVKFVHEAMATVDS